MAKVDTRSDIRLKEDMRFRDSSIGTILGASFSWMMMEKQFQMWGYQQNDIAAIVLGIVIFFPLSWFLSPYLRTRKENRHISPYGVAVSVMLILGWLIPMTLTGVMKASLYTVPVPIRNQYRISCLFTHSSSAWHTVHYQVRKEGQIEWEEGPLEGFFDLDIFGYRSKLNRIALASRSRSRKTKLAYGKGQMRFEEMGRFIAQRWSVLYPEDPAIQEVRFYRVGHKVGEEHCMSREVWSRPPLDSIPNNKWELLSIVELGEKEDKSGQGFVPLNPNLLPKFKPKQRGI